jgi:protein-tyrosine phosphatase
MSQDSRIGVLFVCLGNICRSPTAHGVFETLVASRNLEHAINVDSCGTGDWHIGHAPDRRAAAEARRRGYELDHLRARQVVPGDFDRFDYILAMDRVNLADLQVMEPPGYQGYLGLFLSFAPQSGVAEVPDPYYGAEDGFSQVLELVETASEGLLEEICIAHSLR